METSLKNSGASGGRPPMYQRLKVNSAAMMETPAAVKSAIRGLNLIKAGFWGQVRGELPDDGSEYALEARAGRNYTMPSIV